VTNGQRPAYVDFSDASIVLVRHDEIFPKGAPTPSFNTFAIDTCVHEIEGLSEVFVRFSDDFMIGRPVSKGQFLGLGDLGQNLVSEHVFNRPSPGYYYESLQLNSVRFWQEFRYLPLHDAVHAPQLRRRSTMRALVERWPEWFEQTRHNRFRGSADARVMFLYPYFALFQHRPRDLWQLGRGRDAPGMVRVPPAPPQRGALAGQVTVGVADGEWRSRLNRLVANPPVFLNINDDMPARPDGKDTAFVGERLCRLFPKASPYEINPAMFPGYARVAAPGPQGAAGAPKDDAPGRASIGPGSAEPGVV
jgi:hypothetical protein